MKSFISNQTGRTFILRMERGDLLREALKVLIQSEDIKNAVIVSGIATFDKAHFQIATTYGFPIEYKLHQLEQPLEVTGLSGTIINYEPHLHAVVSSADQTWSGHLLDGCRILYLGEVVIQEFLGADLIRKPDENGVLLIDRNA